jgi:hypothetical protein
MLRVSERAKKILPRRCVCLSRTKPVHDVRFSYAIDCCHSGADDLAPAPPALSASDPWDIYFGSNVGYGFGTSSICPVGAENLTSLHTSGRLRRHRAENWCF